MKPTWDTFNSWVAVGVTCALAWIASSSGWVALGRSDRTDAWQPPVMIENPFTARPLTSEASSEDQLSDPTLPIPGEPIDSERLPIYRLPPITPIDLPAEIPIEMPSQDERPVEIEMPPDDFADASEVTTDSPRIAAANPSVVIESSPYTVEPRDGVLFTPTSTELTAHLLPAVQRACDLAQRGALYAAKTEFIQVIRRIAQVNDAERGTDEHSRALAEGLRALEEAADFVPDGAGLEGELDVAIAASSHRTSLARQSPRSLAPHTAVALYHGFAQERLAAAVAGQQAGSMALYGLGKVHARLAEQRDNDVLATRSAMTMYLAALAASPANHLAANELGVLLCRSGHASQAAQLFEQTIDQAPMATAYHNLAVAQQKLGLAGEAAANEQESARLAAWERATGAVSRRAGVQWVPPDQFAQVARPLSAAVPAVHSSVPSGMPTAQNAPIPMPYSAAPASPKSPLQKAAAMAKSISLPGTGGANNAFYTAPTPRAVGVAPTARPRNIPWY